MEVFRITIDSARFLVLNGKRVSAKQFRLAPEIFRLTPEFTVSPKIFLNDQTLRIATLLMPDNIQSVRRIPADFAKPEFVPFEDYKAPGEFEAEFGMSKRLYQEWFHTREALRKVLDDTQCFIGA